MEKISRKTSNQIKNGNFVITSVQTHGNDVIEDLAQKLELDPEIIRKTFDAFTKYMTKHNDELSRFEESLTGENADDIKARLLRNEAFIKAYPNVTKSKYALTEAFGEEAVRGYGLSGDTPNTSKLLEEYLKNSIKLLRDTPREYEDDVLGTISTEKIADLFEKHYTKLKEVHSTLDRETRETQLAYEKREAQSGDWSGAYRGIATAMEGYYRIAEAPQYAERIRDSSRKRSGREGPTAEEATPDETTTEKNKPDV